MRTSVLNQPRGICEEESVLHSKGGHVSLIRKELVTLTGNHTHAVILNQLLYWTQKTKDFCLMLEEEKNRKITTTEDFPQEELPQEESPQEESPRHGWIYKTASDLVEETMLHIDRTTLRRYLKFLVKQKWLFERSNPQNKWNKTIQYRVNVQKIQEDLMVLGLSLSEIPLSGLEKVNFKSTKETSTPNGQSNVYILPLKLRVESWEEQACGDPLSKPAETSNGQIARSNEQNARSNGHNAHSNGQIARSNTENTTEITNREHTARARKIKNVLEEEKIGITDLAVPPSPPCAKAISVKTSLIKAPLAESIVEIWEKSVASSSHLTQKRKEKLLFVLNAYFQNDMTQWQQFCERVSCSPFLMGHGPRKWRVSLDWILVEENLIKVLEGNFDNPEDLEKKQTVTSNAEKTKEIDTILASIEDPMWRKWCSQLDFESRNAVSLSELKIIANAKFLEIEGDRLIWVGSSDPQVLSRIEDLRLKLLPLTQRTFPKVRNLRTRRCEDPSVIQKETNQQLGELS